MLHEGERLAHRAANDGPYGGDHILAADPDNGAQHIGRLRRLFADARTEIAFLPPCHQAPLLFNSPAGLLSLPGKQPGRLVCSGHGKRI